MNFTYRGRRLGPREQVPETLVERIDSDGEVVEILPNESLAVRSHSPTGFEWGYGGSGPAQLALALLLDHFLVTRGSRPVTEIIKLTEDNYQEFKWAFVSRWDDRWEITSAEITEWVNLQIGRKGL